MQRRTISREPSRRFTFHRLWAIVLKEFIQMKRDRVTFGMMVGIPLMQLMMFGFAINSDPQATCPTAHPRRRPWPLRPHPRRTRLRTSDYFDLVHEAATEAEAQRLLQLGDVQFVINIPEDFSRKLLRGERPTVLIEADATDPAATGPALAAVSALADHDSRPRPDRPARAACARRMAPSISASTRHYNPENITQYNVVPGLMGVVLTMTMVIITALAITRERERGTMENLLATPVRPFEVMVGKILPYIAVGYIQVSLILVAAHFIFEVPMVGSLPLLYVVSLLFIAANLAVGITFSTLAKNQLQAVQMAFFFFLPSILLSGFMFPFRGMPDWAQAVGSCLPNTHFLRIVRGILLKGNGLAEIAPRPLAVARSSSPSR